MNLKYMEVSFSIFLDKAMTERGLSNYKVAKDTGLSETSIGNYRSGKKEPIKANRNVLLNYFGVGQNNSVVAEPVTPYNNSEVDSLKREVADLRAVIDRLDRQIEGYLADKKMWEEDKKKLEYDKNTYLKGILSREKTIANLRRRLDDFLTQANTGSLRNGRSKRA